MDEIRRGKQHETDMVHAGPGEWFRLATVADWEAAGRMLRNILDPDLPPGPPYMHAVTNGPSITCPRCGMTSWNGTDVEQGYCGHCHDWTSARGYT
jgi:ribosomal protein L37E